MNKAKPDSPPDAKQRYLFGFRYENLEQRRLNALFNDDSQCQASVWIEATSPNEAVELGRAYADLYVMHQFDTSLSQLLEKAYLWSNEAYDEWVEEDPIKIQTAVDGELPTIRSPSQLVRHFAQ